MTEPVEWSPARGFCGTCPILSNPAQTPFGHTGEGRPPFGHTGEESYAPFGQPAFFGHAPEPASVLIPEANACIKKNKVVMVAACSNAPDGAQQACVYLDGVEHPYILTCSKREDLPDDPPFWQLLASKLMR